MSDITANVVVSMPSQLFTMARSFKAVANGEIYIGKIDTDPVNPENRVQVYVENEDGSHVPVSQPIIINAAGYPVYNGQIAKFVTVQGHSMAVYDAYGAKQFYFPNILKYDPDQLEQRLAGSAGAGLIGYGETTIDQVLYHTPEEFKTTTNTIDDAISLCLSACSTDGKRAWLRNTYQISQTIHVPVGVYVQLDGTIEIISDIDGIHLTRESKLIGGGTVIRSRSLDSYTKTAVIIYGIRSGRTIGCVDNILSGIRIMNGWVDYSNDSFGIVIDPTKMTGNGVRLLAGSWAEGYTTEKSNEYCWKNHINNIFIEGYNNGISIRTYADANFITWVNGNKFSQLSFNRCVQNIRIDAEMYHPDTQDIRGEASDNEFSQIDIQWYSGITNEVIFCSGRMNTFEVHVHDYPSSNTGACVKFNYFISGVPTNLTAPMPRDNVIKVTGFGAGSINRSCDRWGNWLYERWQGQNRVVAPGALTDNFIPEDMAPSGQSPKTNHYLPVVDDCLAYSTQRKTSPVSVTLYVNGSLASLSNPVRMFNPIMENFAETPTLNSGDYFDLNIILPSPISAKFVGFSFGELSWATSYTPRIRMYDSSSNLLYDRVLSGASVVTGHIDIGSVKSIQLSVTNITGSGKFPISRAFAKAGNIISNGFINPASTVPFVDDITIDRANGGLKLWTPDGTKQYKISVNNSGVVIATLL